MSGEDFDTLTARLRMLAMSADDERTKLRVRELLVWLKKMKLKGSYGEPTSSGIS